MSTQQINRVSTVGLTVLSLIAFVTVLLGLVVPATLSGRIPPPQPDEGTAAHIFQLAIVALVPTGLVFLATADWTRPLRNVRRLALPATAVVLAFSILYYFETYYPAHHG
jgi:protein-S-isoprenylcysteine O-methyltransferase Ste14